MDVKVFAFLACANWVSSSTFFLERHRTAGQAPLFLFSSLSSSVCQLLCANSLKRPSSSLCQKSVWQSRWAETWQLQSDSLGDIYQFWRAENTVERRWNEPLNIWIICSALSPSWNDRKQHSDCRQINSFCTVSLAFLSLPFLHHTSPPLTGHMCCSAVL